MFKLFKKKYSSCTQTGLWALFLVSFVLWVFSFRKFLTGDLTLTSDAVSYFEHIKFYIDSLLKGVYPMWDPVWNNGVPNEFFLRRFGSFNPFFSFLVFLRCLGIPHFYAYMIFLSSYYFLACLGFFFLAQKIFKNQLVSFCAYLLLLFSSFGTRLFDSYLLFEFAPLIWFFVFLVFFLQRPAKKFFVGMIFTVMIILTTYIPFYFLIIFLVAFLCLLTFYPGSVKPVGKEAWAFVKQHRLLTLILCGLLLVSLIPGILMVVGGGQDDIVLPNRHSASSSENVMQVGFKTIQSWGILEDILYSVEFSDFHRFKFAVLYIPFMGYILLFLGLFMRIRRKDALFFLFAVLLYLCSSLYLPFYPFLYKHVFFFKYFRNLHFFLWWGLLPIFILFAVSQLDKMLQQICDPKQRTGYILNVIGVHLLFLIFMVWYHRTTIVASYLTWAFSLLFFLSRLSEKFREKRFLPFVLLSLAVCAQPLQVYHYLQKNESDTPLRTVYNRKSLDTPYDNQKEKIEIDRTQYVQAPSLYYAARRYDFLRSNIHYDIFRNYLRYKFILYDNAKAIVDRAVNFKQIENSFLKEEDLVFLSGKDSEKVLQDFSSPGGNGPIYISGDTEKFHVLKYGPNKVKIKTSYPVPKILVYNDSFHPQWRVKVNGKDAPLLRANIAFKGVILPAGANEVMFAFGSPGKIFLNVFLFAGFYALFVYLIFLFVKDLKQRTVNETV